MTLQRRKGRAFPEERQFFSSSSPMPQLPTRRSFCLHRHHWARFEGASATRNKTMILRPITWARIEAQETFLANGRLCRTTASCRLSESSPFCRRAAERRRWTATTIIINASATGLTNHDHHDPANSQHALDFPETQCQAWRVLLASLLCYSFRK